MRDKQQDAVQLSDGGLLRVVRIGVKGLFGRYDHKVDLRTVDRVTIIHGPNGIGKTVLLRLVFEALSGKLGDLLRVPYTDFGIELSDGATIGFVRKSTKRLGDAASGLTCYLRRPGHEELHHDIKASPENLTRIAEQLERGLPWVSRIDHQRYLDNRVGDMLTPTELWLRYGNTRPALARRLGIDQEPLWLAEARRKVGVHLIEAQRLLRFEQVHEDYSWRNGPGQYVETVKNYARDLHARISETLTLYAKQSQALDQSFPQRLLSSAVIPLSAEQLKERMRDLELKRSQLKQIGLVDEAPAYPFDVAALDKLDETRRTVMTLYVDDTASKLGVLDDFARRVEILLGNINRKFTHKSILIDRDKGLVAKTEKGESLGLDTLSSGEQHELVLLYDLLFRVQANTLVLIDEPELSLHVTWQKSFLPDLVEIVGTTGFDVLLATHSPFIVGDRHDLLVQLGYSTDLGDVLQ